MTPGAHAAPKPPRHMSLRARRAITILLILAAAFMAGLAWSIR